MAAVQLSHAERPSHEQAAPAPDRLAAVDSMRDELRAVSCALFGAGGLRLHPGEAAEPLGGAA
ncbi:unnamed protein product, partial [Prorocentrum cordatum]